MKKILVILVVVVVAAFVTQAILNRQNKTEATTIVNDLGVINSTNRENAVAKFAGKPAVVFIVGTFCPHCQASMPEYKTKIWDLYKDKVGIFAHVIDGKSGKRFEVADIPQGYDSQLSFENLTGESCDYVPSWVLLDAEGSVVDSSCGAKKGIDVIQNGLDSLLNSNSQELSL